MKDPIKSLTDEQLFDMIQSYRLPFFDEDDPIRDLARYYYGQGNEVAISMLPVKFLMELLDRFESRNSPAFGNGLHPNQ